MEKLIFATNNKNKVEEVKSLVGNLFTVISLKEAGIEIEIPEPYDTLEENATEKSKTIFALTGQNCFSEDTGLETEALDGQPGVKSARFAGENKSAADNVELLLKLLDGVDDRKARFRTVISLILNGNEKFFSGVCEGAIARRPAGDKGFGYDSIFIPEGARCTFAEMELEVKNTFSHRKKAINKLLTFLFENSDKQNN